MTRLKDLSRSLAEAVAELRLRYGRFRDPVAHARSLGVRVGEDCRLIGVDFGSEPYLVSLGDHVSATATSFVTHDGGAWVFRDRRPDGDLIAPITVGNNVFLGSHVTVLPGVSISDNVVVGAGALVTRDLPPDCVAVGAPAKPIRSLDEYWQSIEPRLVPTKLLGPEEKRRFLLRHFERRRSARSTSSSSSIH